MKKLTTINGLRGLSALWVILAHCGIWGGYRWYNPNAKVAVDIFMMISGFLMMYTSDLVHDKLSFTKKFNWLLFYIRRYFRLSPVFYVTLIVAIILSNLYVPSYHELGRLNNNTWLANINADFSLTNIFYHVTYLFGVLPKYAFSTLLPDWSLGLEMQFYLIFPIIFLYLKSNPTKYSIALFCIITILVSYSTGKYIMIYFSEVSLILYQLPMFLIGVFIYYGFHQSKTKPDKVYSVLIALIFCIYSILIKDHHDNFYLLIAAILLITSCTNLNIASIINVGFDKRIFNILSDLSYSAYLFHGFFLSILGALIERNLYPTYTTNECVLIIILTVIPCTYITSYFSFKYIERPGIKLGRLIMAKMQQKLHKSKVGNCL